MFKRVLLAYKKIYTVVINDRGINGIWI